MQAHTCEMNGKGNADIACATGSLTRPAASPQVETKDPHRRGCV